MTKSRAVGMAFGIVSALFCVKMIFTAYWECFTPDAAHAFARLGFPAASFRVELSLAKLLGVLALLIPPLPARVKELTYAGFALNLVSALVAHASIHDRPVAFEASTITLLLGTGSYLLWRRFESARPSPVSSIQVSPPTLSAMPGPPCANPQEVMQPDDDFNLSSKRNRLAGGPFPYGTPATSVPPGSRGLVEKIKWGKPCFLCGNKNIVLIQRFNDYIALLFFKGALLQDPLKMLSRVGEHMQVPRQLRFRSLPDITRQSSTIKAFIEEAIELEKSGAKVVLKKASELAVPEELQSRLDAEPTLKKAFAGLTPGRQKGYIYQIAAAKQAATRASRVANFVPRILAGKGLND